MKKQMTALGLVALLLLTGCSSAGTELETLRGQVATLTSQRDAARESLQPQSELDEREVAIENREQSLSDWETDLNQLRDKLKEQQAKVQTAEEDLEAREQAIAEKESNAEDWIKDVRQCLARDGDYKSASITWTDFSGMDFSCYTG